MDGSSEDGTPVTTAAETVRPRLPFFLSWMLDNWHRERCGDHARLLRRMGLEQGMRVIDVGCGTGVVTQAISELIGDEGWVLAFEINPRMIERANRRLRHADNVSLVLGDAGDLPLVADSLFDAAVVFYALHEIGNRHQVLRCLGELLHQDGLLLIIEPRVEVGCMFLIQEISQTNHAGFALRECTRTSVFRTELVFKRSVSSQLDASTKS